MFSDRLKNLRKEKGLTQADLATLLNSSLSKVAMWETGKRDPVMEDLLRLSDIFNTSVDYLLGKTTVQTITPSNQKETLNVKDEKDIEKALNTALEQLEHSQEGLMFSGEPLDDETRELLKISLENSMRLAKQIAKNNFNAKKYK
ncbi:MAG: helix-turn-helix domain-containing protein [Clostridium sp.]